MSFKEIPTKKIVPGRNIRVTHDDITELADSVRELGVLNPITVNEVPGGTFETVTGERRLEAAKEAGLETMPTIVRDGVEQQQLVDRVRSEIQRRTLVSVDETTASECRRILEQLTENVQRKDLTPLDEASAVARYLALTGETQIRLVRRLGKTKGYTDELMAINRLSPEEKDSLRVMGQQPSRETLAMASRTRDPELRRTMLAGLMTSSHARETRPKMPKSRKGKAKYFVICHSLTDPYVKVTVRFKRKGITREDAAGVFNQAIAKVEGMKRWPPSRYYGQKRF